MSNTWGKLNAEEQKMLRERIVRADERVQTRFTRVAELPAYKPVYRYSDLSPAQLKPVLLIPPDEFDYDPVLTEKDIEMAAPIDRKLRTAEERLAPIAGLRTPAGTLPGPDAAAAPVTVDHRGRQSFVKHQLERGTCVAHASLAALEAFTHIPEDLSEQYAHYKFMEFEGKSHYNDSGIRTTDAAIYLARQDGRVCLESEWPYIGDQQAIRNLINAGTYGPPPAAVNNQRYGISAYKIIVDQGLSDESIKNTTHLETLLAAGYDIVFGAWVSWDDTNTDGILEPVLDSNGEPIGQGGHAMLMVGYDRLQRYFIAKNSWGPDWEHQGYGYFHYDFIRSCLKYGFVIDQPTPGA